MVSWPQPSSCQGAERNDCISRFGKVSTVSQFTDNFARRFYYLRLSITDVCNFRCTYCLPDGYQPQGTQNKSFLTLDEIRRVTRAFAAAGTEKVRLTGGEPSMRRDFTDIIAAVRENDAIRQLAVTTNGYRLQRDVARWRAAGLTALNVSIDSLDARQFHAITGQDKFDLVMRGIDAAFDAGFSKVKVNTVLMRDVNHQSLETFLDWIRSRPIQLRFIELMETGDGGTLFRQHHISGAVIRDQLIQQGWVLQARARSDGPAQVFRHEDYQGEIGLIMPYEKEFCASCNRLRVSATGNLHLCLFGDGGVSLRDLLAHDGQQEALQARIAASLATKKQTHFLHQGNTGITQNLSFIGG
ncbi:Molybdenum cofactor biosynthesis protein A [Erwinia tasmaniensis Et1/99]|uniref:GTP 3',8-cyclase n=1 Tax=Erwinia tasmaniensis (strain DSM 17950 / CFBP 7177 / CIP 109463 / NCPPB 4357 / Et1/99) TaxID=465817 RepID=B2VBW7_ERWT9|nr:Molybdenum cofactor biosynthesis protein A [Erwinia tasmaniensis Et1/99]